MSNIDNEIKAHYAQIALEEQAVREGVRETRNAQRDNLEKGRASRNAGSQGIIGAVFPLVTEALEALFKNAPPAAKASLKYGVALGADKCAFLTLNHMFDGTGREKTKVNSAIGRQIRAELDALNFQAANPGLAHVIFKDLEKSTDAAHKNKVLSSAVKRSNKPVEKLIHSEGFDTEVAVKLGERLIDTVIASTAHLCDGAGIFYTEAEESRKTGGQLHTTYFIRMTDEAQALVSKLNNKEAWMNPVRPVMLTKPRDWDHTLTGGYLSEGQKLELLKNASVDYMQEALESGALDSAMRAMNILQGTGYRVNKKVLAVAEAIWEGNMQLGLIPDLEPRVKPEAPHIAAGMTVKEFKAAFPEQWAEWKRKASAVEKFNASKERKSKLLDLSKTMRIARERKDDAAFYLPVQLDYRTRMYYVPNHLNPQTHDLAKGLLEFAHGKALTAEGAHSLAIAGATIWANGGLDKKPLAERAQWVYENEMQILACAKDPINNAWWAMADGGDDHTDKDSYLRGATAFAFLAFCFEWAGWKEQGEGFMSHIICFADGKANGSQHHAAMSRSKTEAAYVCMLPMERPDDLYTRVLMKTNEQIADDVYKTEPFLKPKVAVAAATEEAEDAVDVLPTDDAEKPVKKVYSIGELAELLQGKLSRKIVKRPTMTFSYGSTALGIRDGLAADHKKFFEKFPKEVRGQLVSYLAKTILDSIRKVVSKSYENMLFIQQVAQVVAANNLPLNWTTADGFPVQQQYMRFTTHVVRTTLSGGTRMRIDKTEEVRRSFFKKAKAAIKQCLGKDDDTTAVLFALHESLGYAAWAGITKQYRTMFESGNLEAFDKFMEDTITGCLESTMPELSDALTTLAMQCVVEAHDHLKTATGEHKVTLRKPTDKLNKSKQVTGASPNVVHSADATHLRMTVNACYDLGITEFSAVHDSFGVHAEDYATMNRVLREQFVAMYTNYNPLENLLETAKSMLPVKEHKKLPALPPKGDLDLQDVLKADFFFA